MECDAGRLVARRLAQGPRARARYGTQSLERRGGAGYYEHRADRAQKLSFAEPAGQPGAEGRRAPRPRSRSRAGPSRCPRACADHPGDAHATPTDRLVPTAARGRLADEAEQRRHPQRAQDQAHEAAEDTDRGAGETARGCREGSHRRRAPLSGAAGLPRGRSRSMPKYEKDRADGDEQDVVGEHARKCSRRPPRRPSTAAPSTRTAAS